MSNMKLKLPQEIIKIILYRFRGLSHPSSHLLKTSI